MHRQLICILRVVDVRVLYVFVSLFVIPVCLLLNTNRSRTTAYCFFRERMRYGRLRAAWATYLNHCRFGQIVIDRFAMYAGTHFHVEVIGYEHFLHLTKQTEGFVQLSSHFGCYEVAGYTLVAKNKRLNALVFGEEKSAVMEGRKEILDKNNIRMIPLQKDMGHLFLINEALANHEIVSMPADRIVGAQKSLTVDFLGEKARIPMGPFSVATMRSLDVVSVNVVKASVHKYVVYVVPLTYDKQASRKEQMQQLATSYADELSRKVCQYPTQWFNFYNFWSQASDME